MNAEYTSFLNLRKKTIELLSDKLKAETDVIKLVNSNEDSVTFNFYGVKILSRFTGNAFVKKYEFNSYIVTQDEREIGKEFIELIPEMVYNSEITGQNREVSFYDKDKSSYIFMHSNDIAFYGSFLAKLETALKSKFDPK